VNRRTALFALPSLVLLLWTIAPLVTGARTLYLRDIFNSHLELRAELGRAVRDGRLPLVDGARAGGQGLLGNPNAVPLYPDNVLLLVASDLWQLNAHFWLHWLLALPAMYALARVWGLGREASWAAAVVYAFSGYFISQLNLYNAVVGVALAPALAAALLASRDPARRRWALPAFGGVWALQLRGEAIRSSRCWRWRRALALADAELTPPAVGRPGTGARRRHARSRPRSGSRCCGCCPAPTAGSGARRSRGRDALRRPFRRCSISSCHSTSAGPISASSWGDSYFGGTPALYFSLAPGLLAIAARLRRCSTGARRARGGRSPRSRRARSSSIRAARPVRCSRVCRAASCSAISRQVRARRDAGGQPRRGARPRARPQRRTRAPRFSPPRRYCSASSSCSSVFFSPPTAIRSSGRLSRALRARARRLRASPRCAPAGWRSRSCSARGGGGAGAAALGGTKRRSLGRGARLGAARRLSAHGAERRCCRPTRRAATVSRQRSWRRSRRRRDGPRRDARHLRRRLLRGG
jgi:hypothetical protein